MPLNYVYGYMHKYVLQHIAQYKWNCTQCIVNTKLNGKDNNTVELLALEIVIGVFMSFLVIHLWRGDTARRYIAMTDNFPLATSLATSLWNCEGEQTWQQIIQFIWEIDS